MATTGRSARRVGAENSKMRDELLNYVERIMIEKGYASVSYRAVAAAAEVTPGLVQYYFPTLDDLFLAALRRRGEQNVERIGAALATRPDEPLRVLWEFSREEASASLTTEFLALGNHRKSIRSEIADVTERVRSIQLRAVEDRYGANGVTPANLTTLAFLFVLTGIPKLLRLEESVGASTAHADTLAAFESYLDEVEPPRTR